MTPTVYTFWESGPGRTGPPAYIDLCMRTWPSALPDAEVVCITHRTVADFIGDAYDLELLKRFPLPAQSDAIAVAVLHRHGGLFLDADTILTRPFLSDFEHSTGNCLTMFGVPGVASAHVGFLHAPRPGHPLLGAWFAEIRRRIAHFAGWRAVLLSLTTPIEGTRLARKVARRCHPARVKWHYLSNGILNPLLASQQFSADTRILDRQDSGFILESGCCGRNRPQADYRNFYFTDHDSADRVLDRNRCGIIALHNSWTPEEYKAADEETVLATNNLLSKILRRVLGLE